MQIEAKSLKKFSIFIGFEFNTVKNLTPLQSAIYIDRLIKIRQLKFLDQIFN
jgi:hypothetical protein